MPTDSIIYFINYPRYIVKIIAKLFTPAFQ